MSSFKDLRIVDNFYQTSSYFPMPTVMISTLAEDGSTSVGSYSLCFPYYIAGKDYYAMVLEARNSDTPAEKMKNFGFTLEDGLCFEADPSTPRPKVIAEAYQVMECTWMSDLENATEDIGRKLVDGCYPPPYRDFNGITTQYGAHFILRIDKMLMKPQYHDNIINGVKGRLWPNVLICHGYRDSKNFWFAKTPRLKPELLPLRNASLDSVRYAADRTDPEVHFTDDALEMLLNVPRIFLPTVLKGCVAWAKEHGVKEVTAVEMQIINDKRSKEKGKG